MSLQIWLPLTGDLHNQGLYNFTPTNTGANVDSSGKIGSCYSFDGTDDSISIPFNSVITGTEYSIALWFYKDSLSSKNYDTIFGGPSGFEIETRNAGGTDPLITAWNWGKGTIAYEFGKWYHLTVTRNSSATYWYLDGELKLTGTAGSLPSGNYFLGSWSTTTGQNYKGKVNDFRIYDHCLSPREVKEISKGLVLHYPLNDAYLESTTNLGNTSATYSNQTEGNAYSAGSWGGDAGTVTYYKSGGYSNYPYKVYHKTATGTGGMYRKTDNDIILEEGKTYTMSVYVKASRNYSDSAYSFNINRGSDNYYINYGKSIPFTTEWQRLEKTFTVGSGYGGSYGEMSIIYDDTVTDYYVYYSGFQIEEKDHATPYTPSSRSETTVYDTSGYGNNGTKSGTITISANSPRYNNCYYFEDNTDYITDTLIMPTDQVTMCYWYKTSATGVGGYHMPLTVGGRIYEASLSSSGLRMGHYISGTRYVANYKDNTNLCDGNWHFCCTTYDGTTQKAYIDGNLVGSKSISGTLTGGSQLLQIGILDNGTYGNNQGYESDVRIYATALSAADVKELYNTPIAIANNGTLMTQGEVIE